MIKTNFTDNNIFHILAAEIFNVRLEHNEIIIDDTNIDLNHECQKWRIYVFSQIFEKVLLKSENGPGLNSWLKYKSRLQNNFSFKCHEFIEYEPSKRLIEITEIINRNKCHEKKYVLLNQRNFDDRYLYETGTGGKLEDYLGARLAKDNIAFKHCNFSDLSAEEQHGICCGAKVFIGMHGAGNTNLIFTPQGCPLIEVNFRKDWFCDTVCDDHFNGKIGMDEECSGTLSYRPYYHKADFHNLCALLGKKYLEIGCDRYEGGWKNRNPISKKRCFVDGNSLLQMIRAFF